MAKMGFEDLKAYVGNVVSTSGLSNASFVETRNNVVGLIDKIGKIITVDTVFTIDKLSMFDGEYLSFGKTIEEWQQDLIMVEDKDESGANALAPHSPTYRPVYYSYSVGKKVIATTLRNNDIERAVHFSEQFASIVAMQTKRLEDSMAQYRYAVKREMIGKLYELTPEYRMADGDENEKWDGDTYAESTGWATAVGLKAISSDVVIVSGDSSLTDATLVGAYVCVKEIAAASTKTLVELIEEGFIVRADMVCEIAKPVDTSTGEAFIKQVKADLEIASDSSEGHSLNGNCLGATESLVLVVRQGVIPSLEVDTYAGAFQVSELGFPAEMIVVKDFGEADEDVFAVLLDRRGLRLHNTYNATRENVNGEGDFLNIFRHTEDTAYASRNTFVKFYKAI